MENCLDTDDATAEKFSEALARCDSEPIHLIGAIQDHGFLLAFDSDWHVRLASYNTVHLFDLPFDEIIDSPAAALLGAEAAAALAERSAPTTCQTHLQTRLRLGGEWKPATLWLHRSGELLVCEIDLLRQRSASHGSGQEVLSELIRQLEQSNDTAECCRMLARQFQTLTGFDRVLVYRFDDSWDGEVIAEAGNGAMPSLLGNHFPAGDIPAQARALYARNPVRALADTEAMPTHVGGGPEAISFDMSLCILRSMSPIHLEYLRNMGARASLSVSLMMHGRLWGLIACHNVTPLRLSLRRLALVEIAGRTASLKLSSLEDRHQVNYLDQIRRVLGRLTDLFTKTQDTEAISQLLERDILALVGATGCLLSTPEQQFVAGHVPAAAPTAALLAWLHGTLAEQRVFATDHLAAHWPDGAAIADAASGVLAISLAPGRQLYVVWFREEIIRDIPWAGQPQKTATHDHRGVRIEPRRSFAQWVETVRGKSRKWEDIQIDAATTISHALQAIFTERSLWAMEHDLRVTAESASRLKGEFLSNVSHELRTPLHAILAFGNICLKRLHEVPADKLRNYLDSIMTSANRLNHLIEELLNLAQLQSGKVSVSLRSVDMASLVSTLVGEMQPLFDGRSLNVSLTVETAERALRGDSMLLGRVIQHLLANAQKFSPNGGAIDLVLRDGELPGPNGSRAALEFIVLDQGPGIPEEELAVIFESFTQSKRTYRGDGGSGLGLAVCREIIILHKGSIAAANRPEGGARISCLLPRS